MLGRGGGTVFYTENPKKGGLPGRGGRGQEGVCRQFGEGGLNIFFGGRNSHQAKNLFGFF